MENDAKRINPDAEVVLLSLKTMEGFDKVLEFIEKSVKEVK